MGKAVRGLQEHRGCRGAGGEPGRRHTGPAGPGEDFAVQGNGRWWRVLSRGRHEQTRRNREDRRVCEGLLLLPRAPHRGPTRRMGRGSLTLCGRSRGLGLGPQVHVSAPIALWAPPIQWLSHWALGHGPGSNMTLVLSSSTALGFAPEHPPSQPDTGPTSADNLQNVHISRSPGLHSSNLQAPDSPQTHH